MAFASDMKRPSRQLEGWRFAPRVHLEVPPCALLSAWSHVVDDFFELIGNTLFMHEEPQALRIRKHGRGRK